MLCSIESVARWWIGFEENIELVGLLPRRAFHFSMLKESSEQGALTDPPPVERCFVDEEIEEGIIGRGDGAPEAGLARFLLLTLGQVPCLPRASRRNTASPVMPKLGP